MAGAPVLVVISGPAGAGKTTLAHRLARALGCPAICRDDIKEGMMNAAGRCGGARRTRCGGLTRTPDRRRRRRRPAGIGTSSA